MKLAFKPNPAQQRALEHLYDPENKDGEPWDPTNPVAIEIVHENGKLQLSVGGAYLHEDGEWATFPEPDPVVELTTFTFDARGTVETNLPKTDVGEAIIGALITGLRGSAAMDSEHGPMHSLEVDKVDITEQARSIA